MFSEKSGMSGKIIDFPYLTSIKDQNKIKEWMVVENKENTERIYSSLFFTVSDSCIGKCGI
ncbi:hypothetical protein MmTuc01_3312 [Methanosarcina mazei Tuc01]|uniref:Uncharacterized protein n=1 Tax=Methanosarcina mazei Tuc01 TaxID=1236903 RepID=M1Q1X6_METMZ|nr:hypothetical protein MmTuc01_3312 [Methanosarcina mazei Tuc01]